MKHVEEDGDLHQVDPPADVVVPDHEQVNINVEQVTWPGVNQVAITSSPSNRRLAGGYHQVVIDQSRWSLTRELSGCYLSITRWRQSSRLGFSIK